VAPARGRARIGESPVGGRGVRSKVLKSTQFLEGVRRQKAKFSFGY